jgi:hypothetical protein
MKPTVFPSSGVVYFILTAPAAPVRTLNEIESKKQRQNCLEFQPNVSGEKSKEKILDFSIKRSLKI